MEHIKDWKDIAHQLRVLSKGSDILSKIFCNGTSRDIELEDLEKDPDFNQEIVNDLLDYGVLAIDNETLYISNPHKKYFEECQAVNNISVGVIIDCSDRLYKSIEIYRLEKNLNKKNACLRDIYKNMRDLVNQANHQASALKYEVQETYRQEHNIEKKLKLLDIYKSQTEKISELIKESTQKLTNEAFFLKSADISSSDYYDNTMYNLNQCYNWLTNIYQDAIKHLNKIEGIIEVNRKIRKLKYLYDLKVLDGETNIREILSQECPIWLNRQPQPSLKVSINSIKKEEIPPAKIKELLSSKGLYSKKKPSAPPLSEAALKTKIKQIKAIDPVKIWNKFKGTSFDLMTYINNHDFTEHGTWEEELNLFCKVVNQNIQECKFGKFVVKHGIAYPEVYVKQK